MEWPEALKVLRRTVQVIHASPDPNALPHKTSGEDGEAPQEETETLTPSIGVGSGWVKYLVFYYESGQIVRQEVENLRQRDFAEFLRTGRV